MACWKKIDLVWPSHLIGGAGHFQCTANFVNIEGDWGWWKSVEWLWLAGLALSLSLSQSLSLFLSLRMRTRKEGWWWVMEGKRALMTLILSNHQPLMKILPPWKSKIRNCFKIAFHRSSVKILRPIFDGRGKFLYLPSWSFKANSFVSAPAPTQPQNKQSPQQIWNTDNNNLKQQQQQQRQQQQLFELGNETPHTEISGQMLVSVLSQNIKLYKLVYFVAHLTWLT